MANALDKAGAKWEFTTEARKISSCDKLIIPGVGNAKTCMRKLTSLGLDQTIRSLQQPVLGICIGMQILFDSSEEFPEGPCLGIIPGKVEKMLPESGFPVPHMGWNQLKIEKDSLLLRQSDSGQWVYFVHSFAGERGPWTTAGCTYNGDIPAAVEFGNFIGLQFHPEKSGCTGINILKRFVEL